MQKIDSRKIPAKKFVKKTLRDPQKNPCREGVGLPLAVIVNALEIYPALGYRAAFAELLT